MTSDPHPTTPRDAEAQSTELGMIDVEYSSIENICPETLNMMADLIEREQNFPIKILKNEALLLTLVKKYPSNPVKYYMTRMPVSYRGFFNIMDCLLKKGLIQSYESESDKRQKLLK